MYIRPRSILCNTFLGTLFVTNSIIVWQHNYAVISTCGQYSLVDRINYYWFWDEMGSRDNYAMLMPMNHGSCARDVSEWSLKFVAEVKVSGRGIKFMLILAFVFLFPLTISCNTFDIRKRKEYYKILSVWGFEYCSSAVARFKSLAMSSSIYFTKKLS